MNKNTKNNGPIRVLLVEDDPGDVRLVREYLSGGVHGNFELVDVARIKDALKEIQMKRPDAILLDLYLPDVLGIDGFTRVARAMPGVPIIVLTGLGDAAIEKQLMALGARDYLRKGHFDGRHLAAVIINWVSLARAFA
jgi:DNA-binding response OmpR family regulator